MQRYVGLVALLLPMIGGSASGDEAGGDIWERSIMKMPFDKTAFREIRIPDWVRDADMSIYCVYLTNQYDQATEFGWDFAEVPFVQPMYVYYDSKFLKERDPNVPADHYDKVYEEYRKRGLRILSAHGPWLQAEIYWKHPEWRAISTNTTQIPELDPKQNPHGGRLCHLGPWGDYLIEIMAEIMAKYPDVVGFNFDGIHHFGPCYCNYCRDAYRKGTGEEIPDLDMNNIAFRRYLLWQDRRMEDVVERMQRRIKSIRPDAAIVTYTTNAGRFGHLTEVPHGMSARMNLLFDGIDQEFWMDETNRGNSIFAAISNEIAWAVTNHRVAYSTPYLMSHGNPYGTDSFPAHELLCRTLLTMTHGALPAVAVMWPNLNEAAFESIREYHRRSKWVTHKKPEPWAAVVMGDYTRQFYGRESSKMEERYLSNVFGAYRAALEEHLPMTVINEWNLNTEDLSAYKVLVLANTAVISDEQAAAIRQYVSNGGGLVATVDASLLDELGNPRPDYALADVFGVEYKGIPSSEGGKGEQLDINFVVGLDASYWEKRKNIFDFKASEHSMFDSPKLKTLLGQGPVSFKGQAVNVVSGSNAEVVGTITVREADAQPSPAVIARNYGKGKVVFLAAGFDSAYYLYPYPYQRLVLAQAMRWVASEAPRISVDAPMCVNATFCRQKKDGERLVVQLFNNLNTSATRAKPEDDVPLREETVAIPDIKVAFRGYQISRVHLQPEGVDLPTKQVDGGIEVTVPRLEIHSMVIAELKP